MDKTNAITLTGTLARVTFHSDETGYAVLKITPPNSQELLTITGKCVHVLVGEQLECTGHWTTHPQYGKQFQCEHIRNIPPSTQQGIEKYLASGLVDGIGPHFAKRLVKAFGKDVFTVIEETPERLFELEGIGPKRQQQLVKAWSDQKVVRDIIVFLHSHGLGSARAVRIYKTYGDQAVQHIQQNPYRLATDIPGIGFTTADQLAQKLGIQPDALIRGYAGLYHLLQNAATQGHCGLPRTELITTAVKLLDMPEDRLSTALAHLIDQGQVIESENLCCLETLYSIENELAMHLQRIASAPIPWPEIDISAHLAKIAQGQFQPSASQIQALSTVVANKVTIITGGPGVGKTTLTQSIIEIISSTSAHIILAAPTGRAAKRLSQATGREAKTIHRLLAFDPQQFDFSHNQDNPLIGDLLVIDEASMIDVKLMTQLVRAVPDNMAILMVGDVDQLPSVGPGMVLSDMITFSEIATVRLTEIFRQAASSKIIINAHKVNQGLMPDSADPDHLQDFYIIAADDAETVQQKILTIIQERIPKRFQLDPINEVQVLTPMQKGPLGAKQLNILLQKAQNPNLNQAIERFGQRFAPGDKVLQTVNNYDKNVFNGDLGFITRIDTEQRQLIIEFEKKLVTYEFNELDEIQLAYATTIHKSQGSEYPAVVMPMTMAHYMLLERNLLYTGITRGKQLVVLIGERRAIRMAVQTQKAQSRHTRLVDCLRQSW